MLFQSELSYVLSNDLLIERFFTKCTFEISFSAVEFEMCLQIMLKSKSFFTIFTFEFLCRMNFQMLLQGLLRTQYFRADVALRFIF